MKFTEYVISTLSHVSTIFTDFQHHNIIIEDVIIIGKIIFLYIKILFKN
ncbi:MAG: hypothetical protein WCG25_02860 [bacterium]